MTFRHSTGHLPKSADTVYKTPEPAGHCILCQLQLRTPPQAREKSRPYHPPQLLCRIPDKGKYCRGSPSSRGCYSQQHNLRGLSHGRMEVTGGWGSASTLLKAQHGVGLEDQASLPTGWFSHAGTWGLHELKKWQLYYLF